MYIIFTQSDCDIFSRKIEKKLKKVKNALNVYREAKNRYIYIHSKAGAYTFRHCGEKVIIILVN